MTLTLRFSEKVIGTTIDLHADVQPIGMFHVGGDKPLEGLSGLRKPDRQSGRLSQKLPQHAGALHASGRRHHQQEESVGGVWGERAVGHADNVPIDKKHLHNVDLIAYA